MAGWAAPSYQRDLFLSEIISRTGWLYHRFSLSFREVEELLAKRSITVTYESPGYTEFDWPKQVPQRVFRISYLSKPFTKKAFSPAAH